MDLVIQLIESAMKTAIKNSLLYNAGDTCICGVYGCGQYPPKEDGSEPGEECGRWSNGHLERFCAKAGSEECDFECPYWTRNTVKFDRT